MVYKCFDYKTELGAKASANEVLGSELHKTVIKKFKRKII